MILKSSKADTHLFFNSFHNSFFDLFFHLFTYLGDGITATLIVVMLFAIKYRYAVIVAVSSLLSAGITQSLKHFIFEDIARPKKFFEGLQELYFVPGVQNHLNFSFPSGHTTSAFSLYFALAFSVKQKRYKLLFFILAVLTGYSRIYLSQHFLEDVVVGSLIGTLSSILVYYFINLYSKEWMEGSLIDSLRKTQ